MGCLMRQSLNSLLQPCIRCQSHNPISNKQYAKDPYYSNDWFANCLLQIACCKLPIAYCLSLIVFIIFSACPLEFSMKSLCVFIPPQMTPARNTLGTFVSW